MAVAGAVATALMFVAACGGSPDLEPGARPDVEAQDEPPPDDADAGTTTPDEDRDRLAARDYETGDCVTWDGSGEGSGLTLGVPAETDVVDCTQEHHLQVTRRAELDQPGYPSEVEWQAMLTEHCAPAAELVLGAPHDPYGRVVLQSIRPESEAWAQGDRFIWCGVALMPEVDRSELYAGDLRDVDQAFQFEPGTCVANPPLRLGVTVVDCGRPHHREVVARIDLHDHAEMPSVEAQQQDLHPRCATAARDYLGAEPVPPWDIVVDRVTAESWAAGTRTVYCSLAQHDGAGNERPVEGTARPAG
jgi:hypothetical protein